MVVQTVRYRALRESISEMKLSQSPASVTARFDDPNLIGCAGLVPAMRLAEAAGLHKLVRAHVRVPGDKGANAGLKVASLVAGMAAGADGIDDMDLVRHGGMGRLFGGTRAPSTLGSFLRAFTFGHTRQLDAVASRFLLGLDHNSGLLGPRGATGPVMLDVDDTLARVHGAKQGAAFGHAKILGLDALLGVVSGEGFAPVVFADRLRKGSAGSARGASRLIRDALATVGRPALAGRQVWTRADSGFYTSEACRAAASRGGWFSVTVKLNTSVSAAVAAIPEDAWTTIEYPDAWQDPDTGQWVSRAEVAETAYTAFTSTKHPMAVRLVVRRIPDWQAEKRKAQGQDPLLAAWRHHAFITNVPADQHDAVAADHAHRGHAIIEQVNADLKASALKHMPSGKFPANTAWLTLACMAFNLLRALATLADDPSLAVAETPTLRQRLINVPARIAASARRIVLHLPLNWKWATSWQAAFHATHHHSPAP